MHLPNESVVNGLIQQMQSKLLSWVAVREHGDLELQQKFQRSFAEKVAQISPQDWEFWQQSAPEKAEAILAFGDWQDWQSRWQSLLQQAQAQNWQSDERYIEAYVNQALQKGQGAYKIRQTLQQRTSRSDLIEAYLDLEASGWIALAQQVLEKKYGDARKPSSRNEQAKRMRFLQSRGFTSEQIWKSFD